MKLPTVEYPINKINLSSLGKSVDFRPMLVKEEKVLLIAKQSGNENDIFTAIKQIVKNCLLDPKVNVDALPLFDLEYAFLALRIRSIGDTVELSYKDTEDGQEYRFNVNLDEISIKYPEEPVDPNIPVTDKVGIVMRYPPASLYDNERFLHAGNVSDISEELLLASVDKVYDDENVYETSEIPKNELVEFVENIDSTSYRKMQEFLSNVPHMEHVIKYKNSNGTERSITLRTLNDFFTL